MKYRTKIRIYRTNYCNQSANMLNEKLSLVADKVMHIVADMISDSFVRDMSRAPESPQTCQKLALNHVLNKFYLIAFRL